MLCSPIQAKNPVDPTVPLSIVSIAFSLRQGRVGVCSDQRLMPSRNHRDRSPLHPMPTYEYPICGRAIVPQDIWNRATESSPKLDRAESQHETAPEHLATEYFTP